MLPEYGPERERIIMAPSTRNMMRATWFALVCGGYGIDSWTKLPEAIRWPEESENGRGNQSGDHVS